MKSGFQRLSDFISLDLASRFPSQRLTQRRKLSELVTAALMCQSPNTMELSSVLDRPTESSEARYNYVERFLKNPLVKHEAVMEPYALELLERLSKQQHTLVLMIDQSKVNDRLELLMVSVRVKKRALPLFWCAVETKGGIGFSYQERLLEQVHSWLPKQCKVMLSGDRFYGTADLIRWCQEHQWGYRLRLKGNLCVYQDRGDDMRLDQLKAQGHRSLTKARMRSGVVTNIGILHEKGHPEPWYIAMDASPTEYKTRDYGMRWGIESMFSDFKSRGFSLMDSQIRFADRLERLVLILSIALHWATSTGLWHSLTHQENTEKTVTKKNSLDRQSPSLSGGFDSCDDVLQRFKRRHIYGAL